MRMKRFLSWAAMLAWCGMAQAATITVNSANDPAGFNSGLTVGTLGGTVTLRDAVNAANNTPGNDTVVFDASLAGSIIVLTNFQYHGSGATNTALQVANEQLVIQGLTNSGAGIAISGGGLARPFYVANFATLTVNDLTFTNGYGVGNSGGGAIVNDGVLLANRCTFTGNRCDLNGGALSNSGGGNPTADRYAVLVNNTFIGNLAGNGGGALRTGRPLALIHCTIVSNTANANGAGGGLLVVGAVVDATNTIVALNRAAGSANDAVYISASLAGSNNIISSPNPLLGPLAANGGPTLTLAPLPGSPVLDAGLTLGAVTTDQRGVSRPQGAAADIGAFEYVLAPPVFTSPTSAVFIIGLSNSFLFVASGTPTPQYSLASGSLPSGVSLSPDGTLSGIPALGTAGTYPITVSATNGQAPDAVQGFQLSVTELPSLQVTATNDLVGVDGLISLREALTYAHTLGGTQEVTFAPALAGQVVVLSTGWTNATDESALRVTGTIRLIGHTNAPGVTIALAPGVAKRHLQVEASGHLTLVNLTLADGRSANWGGSVWSFGSLVVSNCTFTRNVAVAEGGALQCWGGSPLLQVDNSTFTDNVSSNLASAIGVGSVNASFRHLTITGNRGPNGTLWIYETAVAMTNCIVAGNDTDGVVTSGGMGTGTFAPGSANNLLGTGGSGGLVHGVNGNQLGLTAVQLQLGALGPNGGPTPTRMPSPYSPAVEAGAAVGGLDADQRGQPRVSGAAPDIGAVELAGRLITVNSAADPAGFNAGITPGGLGSTVTLRDALNAAQNGGGATLIRFDPALVGQTILLTNIQHNLSGNAAFKPNGITVTIAGRQENGGIIVDGGGVCRLFTVSGGGRLVLEDLTLRNGNPGPGNGGAVEVGVGVLTARRCLFRQNVAFNGGALSSDAGGTLELEHCTLTENNGGTTGGALLNFGTTRLLHATIAGNTVGSGGGAGVYIFSGSVTATNTLIAGNTYFGGAADTAGQAFSTNSRYNLISQAGGGGLVNGVNGNQIGVTNAGLAPLGDYGGPTLSMALLPGSPARDTALAIFGAVTDQRRAPRPVGAAADIGAYEAGTRTNFTAWIWETLQPTGADHGPAADPDGDGVGNEQEWGALTDAGNGSDFLRALSIGTAGLTFPSVSDRTYHLQQAPAAAGTWSNAPAAPITGDGTVKLFTLPAPATQQFFRVEAGP